MSALGHSRRIKNMGSTSALPQLATAEHSPSTVQAISRLLDGAAAIGSAAVI
jgi:hypothetical protein